MGSLARALGQRMFRCSAGITAVFFASTSAHAEKARFVYCSGELNGAGVIKLSPVYLIPPGVEERVQAEFTKRIHGPEGWSNISCKEFEREDVAARSHDSLESRFKSAGMSVSAAWFGTSTSDHPPKLTALSDGPLDAGEGRASDSVDGDVANRGEQRGKAASTENQSDSPRDSRRTAYYACNAMNRTTKTHYITGVFMRPYDPNETAVAMRLGTEFVTYLKDRYPGEYSAQGECWMRFSATQASRSIAQAKQFATMQSDGEVRNINVQWSPEH